MQLYSTLLFVTVFSDNNQLTGTFPSQFGKLKKLEMLNLGKSKVYYILNGYDLSNALVNLELSYVSTYTRVVFTLQNAQKNRT